MSWLTPSSVAETSLDSRFTDTPASAPTLALFPEETATATPAATVWPPVADWIVRLSAAPLPELCHRLFFTADATELSTSFTDRAPATPTELSCWPLAREMATPPAKAPFHLLLPAVMSALRGAEALKALSVTPSSPASTV